MVTVGGQKMGKSLDNFITLKDAFAKWDPMVLRLFILQSHYRSPLDFSDEALAAAREGLERLVRGSDEVSDKILGSTDGAVDPQAEAAIEAVRSRFSAAMDDDCNTPMALASLFDLAKEANKAAHAGEITLGTCAAFVVAFAEMAVSVLGLRRGAIPLVAMQSSRQWDDDMLKIPADQLPAQMRTIIKETQQIIMAQREERVRARIAGISPDIMRLLVDLRNDARAAKNFAQADAIRKRLDEIGIILEDAPEGTKWRFK